MNKCTGIYQGRFHPHLIWSDDLHMTNTIGSQPTEDSSDSNSLELDAVAKRLRVIVASVAPRKKRAAIRPWLLNAVAVSINTAP